MSRPVLRKVDAMKKYLTMSKSEYALILKLLLCTGLATAVSWTMGDVHNPTTAVTANLCLYVDRGYRGNLLYAVRRILAQLIQGALVLMLILPCKALALPVPDGVLILAACCFAILVGLPLNFKHTYAPLNCTLANATFIISRGSAAAREVQPISLPPFRAECGEDLALLSRLFEYVDAVHPSRQSV